MRPRRSCLFVPGDNAKALAKAAVLDADVVIIDLEDAVAPEAKAAARNAAAAAIATGFGGRETVLRINALGAGEAAADLALARQATLDAVLVPKVDDPGQIATVVGAVKGKSVWAMVETPRAVLALGAIAAAPGLGALVAGTNDLTLTLRARVGVDRAPLLPALAQIVVAARAFGVSALDGVHNDIADEAGLALACRQGRDLGFDGKTLIHPAQIDAANAAFAPSATDVARAQAIVDAFSLPDNAGRGVIKVDGRMTELLHLEEARRTLAMAAAIAARASKGAV